jgi:hypothetical protein
MDKTTQQRKVLANQLVIMGFLMVVFMEINICRISIGYCSHCLGAEAPLVIALILNRTLNATYMLVAILRYDSLTREVSFDQFWMKL